MLHPPLPRHDRGMISILEDTETLHRPLQAESCCLCHPVFVVRMQETHLIRNPGSSLMFLYSYSLRSVDRFSICRSDSRIRGDAQRNTSCTSERNNSCISEGEWADENNAVIVTVCRYCNYSPN